MQMNNDLESFDMSMSDRDGFIWFDGELVPWREAKVHVLTHTLHYGMGVFEGVRAYETDQGTGIFRLSDHTKRLINSAKILGMKIPFSENDLVDSPVSLYAATKKSNELLAYSYSHLYKIPTTGIRFFTVYGPWGRPDMAPMIFAKSILNSKPIKIFNNGSKRPIIFISE